MHTHFTCMPKQRDHQQGNKYTCSCTQEASDQEEVAKGQDKYKRLQYAGHPAAYKGKMTKLEPRYAIREVGEITLSGGRHINIR